MEARHRSVGPETGRNLYYDIVFLQKKEADNKKMAASPKSSRKIAEFDKQILK